MWARSMACPARYRSRNIPGAEYEGGYHFRVGASDTTAGNKCRRKSRRWVCRSAASDRSGAAGAAASTAFSVIHAAMTSQFAEHVGIGAAGCVRG